MDSDLLKRKEELLHKAKEKASVVFSREGMVIPDGLVVEQASSATTAFFTSSLLPENITVADLTAGLGINTYFFSLRAREVYAVELNATRAAALEENLKILGVNNVKVICGDAVEWLKTTELAIEAAFIDPARRSDSGKKLFRLCDCSPNLDLLLPFLKKRCRRLLVKCSPFIDIKDALRTYPETRHVYIIEYKRDVREVLLDMDFRQPIDQDTSTVVSCVILHDDNPPLKMAFAIEDIRLNRDIPFLTKTEEIKKGGFVYEPSPAFMKGGFFGVLAKKYAGLIKLDPNTHIFYSNEYKRGFPGRVFRVEGFFNSKDLKANKGGKFNVISRNHPASPQEIMNRYRLKPSDSRFLIACSSGNKKLLLYTTRI